MQKEQPEPSQTHRIKRTRNASTPDRIKKNIMDSTMTNIRSQHRATMSAADFAFLQSSSKRKLIMDRSVMGSTQILSEGNSIIDSESNDVELKLLYDEYLQNTMTEIILKKKAEERKQLFLSQLATIAKECEHNEEKLFELKTRERDIINLTKIQNDIDKQITDINNCINSEDSKKLNDILSKLHSLLQPLDKLRCNNIILPETPEEWEEMIQNLKSCNATLESITDLIGTKKESYQNVNSGIKEFINTFNNIENYTKRLEKDISDLEVLILKSASLSLAQSDN
ncbi:uncharacterized protein LOC114871115 [Osmia bicornis bicornis]|uniref:uncharacterized protein LOC114871115 n=1 Tax=Osmia bicornis bicornis TaxID=1437191 RepID=UPI0010F74AB3|nr:uncharacterized protein LOC114871115 [Osmia bicornis bicornis]XP_046141875.1 uncharacterized protein LOC114871115 [Osmia bicornis bicornis]XP_046141876.1 uncharacterized protein LOC114871115 [Osmia bicornis bicornis]XP_046141877.1 uncharacterized protein LOC114871115 [Osmia bicornis bicornis]